MEAKELAKRDDRKEMEKRVVDKVTYVISLIDEAKNVDQVIVALCSLAACLFPLDHSSIAGSVDEQYRDKLRVMEIPSEDEKIQWGDIFYKGYSFRTFARVLLYDVACNWLACFPASTRKNTYDVFFVKGFSASEIVQVLVPCLQCTGSGGHNSSIVCSNAERLIAVCFFENDLASQMAREFTDGCQFEDLNKEQLKQTIGRLAQVVTSIPDKARRGAPASLSAHLFFKRLSSQLLHVLEEIDLVVVDASIVSAVIDKYDTTTFVGEVFSRICRRGSADVLLSEIIPLILGHVRSIMSSPSYQDIRGIFDARPGLRFWVKIMEAVTDLHSVERIAEETLKQLALHNANVVEGYWVLFILFGRMYEHQASIRFTFLEKFLLWKVFPLCCLRWIIYFAVLQCSPHCTASKPFKARVLSDTVHRLVVVWSRKEFVQSTPTEQQAYKDVTAALGLCLEKMSKEDLDATKDGMHLILQGVSHRLETPEYLIRKMASSIALVFSKIVDPQNPLYLDDSFRPETIDWEFGLTTARKGPLGTTTHRGNERTDESESSSTVLPGKEVQEREDEGIASSKAMVEESAINLTDPDETIDPAELNKESNVDDPENGYESDDSEISGDSLQPYDLTDDDGDLKRKFSQLVDLVGALRKSDDVEAVEAALDVAEKLIRALPDELKYIAGDLAKTLIHVRCSDLTVEGEEESAEEKRQKALVALIVTNPLESLDCLNKTLYSSNVDISQRLMILDVMTDAAQELASSRILKFESRRRALISSASEQPWFIPRDIGPPGAGQWKEIPSSGTPLNWAYSYERELPSRSSQTKKGTTRRWSHRSSTQDNPTEGSQNCFPQYAAAFMLPAMQGFDKKRHGIDLLGRDSIVLGKVIYMLGVCIKCARMHPEASVLAGPLLDMLRSREISQHPEAHVRRSVLFAASCVLSALHPSYVATAVVEGNVEISEGLEWVRRWALQVSESDADRDCHMLAMGCLHLHAEMALQASRAMDSAHDASTAKSISLSTRVPNREIKIPYLV